MTAPIVCIEFDWPPRALSPNGGQGKAWYVKADATAKYSSDCTYIARAARNALRQAGVKLPLEARVSMVVTFVLRQFGRRDLDNLIAQLKPAQDSLRAAGILTDDSMKYLRPVTYDAEAGPRPLVRVELYEVV